MIVKCFFVFYPPPFLQERDLSTGALTDNNVFPVCHSQLAGVSLVQVKDIEVLEDSRGTAGILYRGSPASPPPTHGGFPGLDVHQGLEERMVIEWVISWWAASFAVYCVKLLWLVHRRLD